MTTLRTPATVLTRSVTVKISRFRPSLEWPVKTNCIPGSKGNHLLSTVAEPSNLAGSKAGSAEVRSCVARFVTSLAERPTPTVPTTAIAAVTATTVVRLISSPTLGCGAGLDAVQLRHPGCRDRCAQVGSAGQNRSISGDPVDDDPASLERERLQVHVRPRLSGRRIQDRRVRDHRLRPVRLHGRRSDVQPLGSVRGQG